MTVGTVLDNTVKIQTYYKIYQDLQESVEDVLRNYAIKQVQQRLAKAQQNVQRWEAKYGCKYEMFAYQTSINMAYVDELNLNFDTMMWESDLIEWEVDMETLVKWKRHLQKLSTNL
jgi:hypothetical protein